MKLLPALGAFTATLATAIASTSMAHAVVKHGTAGADYYTGTPRADRVIVGAGHDVVTPRGGADVVQLGSGNDEVVLEPDGARDVVVCGPGRDTVVWVQRPDRRDLLVNCEEILTIVIMPRSSR